MKSRKDSMEVTQKTYLCHLYYTWPLSKPSLMSPEFSEQKFAVASLEQKIQMDKITLHIAAAEGHIKIMETLLELKADVNAREKNGLSALDLAVKNNLTDMVYVLASAANVNKPNTVWVDPLTELKVEVPSSWKSIRSMSRR
ncbi:hypothetical protein B7494_g5934 [Chlorociboria aeruginascens]|nr:hypothetical protein B7494_g5934 [Chlorociboria aeruginascens]